MTSPFDIQASADLKQGSDMSANPFAQALQMLPNDAKFEDICSNFVIPAEHLQSPKRHPMLSMQQSHTFSALFWSAMASVLLRSCQFCGEKMQNTRFCGTKTCFLMAHCCIDGFKQFLCMHNEKTKQEKCVRVQVQKEKVNFCGSVSKSTEMACTRILDLLPSHRCPKDKSSQSIPLKHHEKHDQMRHG